MKKEKLKTIKTEIHGFTKAEEEWLIEMIGSSIKLLQTQPYIRRAVNNRKKKVK